MIVISVGISVWSVAFELAGVLPILVLDRVGATGVIGGRFFTYGTRWKTQTNMESYFQS